MEQWKKIEPTLDNKQEELSFDQQVKLAMELYEAVDRRNVFVENQGGFDTFAEAGQYIGDTQNVYDKMENVVSFARKEFDEKIPDKKEFVKQLKSAGYDNLSNLISSMFGVSKDGFFSRIPKK